LHRYTEARASVTGQERERLAKVYAVFQTGRSGGEGTEGTKVSLA
jgi:hypothetical protein